MPLVITGNKRSVTSRLAIESVNQGIKSDYFFEISEICIFNNNNIIIISFNNDITISLYHKFDTVAIVDSWSDLIGFDIKMMVKSNDN